MARDATVEAIEPSTLPTTPPPARFPYHDALDGLRALALLAIIAYHLHYPWAHGAFLSVDLFFLLSGFLITTLLIVERQTEGTIDLRRFWARRARRLGPALLVTLAAVAVFTRLEIDPWLRTSVRDDGLASLFYVANWRFIASEQGYFNAFAAPTPLRHMWTLAIEEQFYLVWPLVSLAALRLGRGRQGLVVVCIVGIAASMGVMAWTYTPGTEPLRAYYGTDSRVQVILLGALLAVFLSWWQPSARARRRIGLIGPLAFAAMMAGWATAHGNAPRYYHGGALVHGLVACMVLTSCLHAGPVRTVLGNPVMAWVGRLSYGIYLFHFPIIVWLVPTRVPLDGLALNGLRIGLTVVAAVTSYYLVELPVREGRLPTAVTRARQRWAAYPTSTAPTAPRRARSRPLPAALVALSAVTLTGVVVWASAGGATRPPDYLVGDQQAAARLAESTGEHEVFQLGDPMPCGVPSPEAQTEAAAALRSGGVPAVPNGHAGARILAVGDSTMCSLYPGLHALAGEIGSPIDIGAVIGCGVASGEMTTTLGEQITPNSHRCPGLVDAALEAALQRIDPDVVVWMSVWEKSDLVVDDRTVVSGTPEGDAEIQSRMDQALARLTKGGAKVVILTVAAAAPNDAQGLSNTSNAIDDSSYARLDGILRRFAVRHPDKVSLIDLANHVCPAGPPCPAEVNGVRLRPDGRHFTPAVAVSIARWLMPQILTQARIR